MPAGQVDLFFDQVNVVEQPFASRREMALGLHRVLEQGAGAIQDLLVVDQALKQPIGRGLHADDMRPREHPALAFHLFGGEQGGAQWRFVGLSRRRMTTRCERAYPEPYVRLETWHQVIQQMNAAMMSSNRSPAVNAPDRRTCL